MLEHLGIDVDKPVGCIDLRAQRSLLNGRDHDVCDQRQIGGFDLKALRIGGRLQRLDGAPVEAPGIERIADQHLGGEKVEQIVAAGRQRRAQ